VIFEDFFAGFETARSFLQFHLLFKQFSLKINETQCQKVSETGVCVVSNLGFIFNINEIPVSEFLLPN